MYYACKNIKYLFYSNTYFIQILILFKYLFYSNTYFIQILIYFSNAYFIQILILFIIQILIYLLFKYRGGFDGYMCGELMRWERWENLPSFSQTFQIYPSMGDFIILGAGFPTFPTSFSISIEYTILFYPCKNNNNNNNNIINNLRYF